MAKTAKASKPKKQPKQRKQSAARNRSMPMSYYQTRKKSKKITTEHLVILIAMLFGIVSVMMLLAPCITKKTVLLDESVVNYYMGFKLMFGMGDNLKFNYLMLFTLVFSAMGFVGVILSFALKEKRQKIGSLIAALGFLAAAVFFFLFRAVYPIGVEGGASAIKTDETLSNAKYRLGLGAILGGLFSLVASFTSLIATHGIKEEE